MEIMEGWKKINKPLRAAFAAAALLGGVAASEPKGAEAAPLQSYEQQDFDFNGETNAFLEEIASLDAGMDDLRAKQNLQRKISGKLDIFALACLNRTPYFSAARAQLSGDLTSEGRAAATNHLRRRLSQIPVSRDKGTNLLREMVAGTTAAPREALTSSPASQPSEQGHMPSEVRKNRMGNDW